MKTKGKMKKKEECYSKLEPGWEGEPDFRGELGAKDLGCAIEQPKLERRVVAHFDSKFALSFQFHLLCSTSLRHLLLLASLSWYSVFGVPQSNKFSTLYSVSSFRIPAHASNEKDPLFERSQNLISASK